MKATAIERLRAALVDDEWAAEDRRADALRALAEIEAEWDTAVAPAEADVVAVRRMLRAYRAAAAAAQGYKIDPKLAGHLRAEMRWVARFGADRLEQLARSYRAYALVLGAR